MILTASSRIMKSPAGLSAPKRRAAFGEGILGKMKGRGPFQRDEEDHGPDPEMYLPD
jgi:hypothetical protein